MPAVGGGVGVVEGLGPVGTGGGVGLALFPKIGYSGL